MSQTLQIKCGVIDTKNCENRNLEGYKAEFLQPYELGVKSRVTFDEGYTYH